MAESVISQGYALFPSDIPKEKSQGLQYGGGDPEPPSCHVKDEDYLSKRNVLLHHPSTDEEGTPSYIQEGILKISHINYI